MQRISVLDPSIVSYNLGNDIIIDSVNNFLKEQFNEAFITKLQFTDRLGKKSKRYISNSDITFLAGTNSLSSKMRKLEQFRITIFDLLKVNSIVLLGVGWWQYEEVPKKIDRFILQNLLSKSINHSVRDTYSKEMLVKAGINNVIYTGCPSMWSLDAAHCQSIPSNKARSVLFTFTDYSKSIEADSKLLGILNQNYKNLFFWPQGINDLEYLNEISKGQIIKINYLCPNLSSLDTFLKNHDVDYVGTRLHAGIRAIQFKKRALIVGVDNRALEISRDTNLNVTERNDFNAIQNFIENEFQTNINIPLSNINIWKSQFSIN